MGLKCFAVAVWFLPFLWCQSRISIRWESVAFSFFMKLGAGAASRLGFLLGSLGCFSWSKPSEHKSVMLWPRTYKILYVSICFLQPSLNLLPIPLASSQLPFHLCQAFQAPFHSLRLFRDHAEHAPHQQCLLRGPTIAHRLRKYFLSWEF